MEGTPEIELYICPKASICTKKERLPLKCSHSVPHEHKEECPLQGSYPHSEDNCPPCEVIGEREIEIIKRWRDKLESENV